MVYLLGISHTFQVRTSKPPREGGLLAFDAAKARRFEQYLDNLVGELQPQALCEEEAETQLSGYLANDPAAYSVTKRVGERHQLLYICCDPDQHERDKLYAATGIAEVDDEKIGWRAREGEWLRRISHLLHNSSILFVCSADHVDTLRQKLEAKEVDVKIICQDLDI